MIWPPNYSVKKHPRARRVKLRTSLAHGLQVVVPLRFNTAEIPAILAQHKDWIINQMAQLASAAQPLVLPEKIILPAVQQSWPVKYLATQNKLSLMQNAVQDLALVGKQNPVTAKKLLLHFVKYQAKIHLPLLLHAISQEIQLPYEKVTIRDQKTRWGSCTGKKSISLNYKLLFFTA